MVTLLLAAALAQAPVATLEEDGGCTLEGTLTLTLSGEKVSPSEGVVYLKDGPVRAKGEPVTHTIAQKKRQFVPASLVVLVNDRISFVNEDQEDHSVFSRLGADPFSSDVNSRVTTFARTFNRPGRIHIQCNIHEAMKADVLVVRSPAFTRPDAQGRWKLTGLPRRAFTLVAWEPNGGEESREVAACATGPVALTLTKKPPAVALRRDGSRYGAEYQPPY